VRIRPRLLSLRDVDTRAVHEDVPWVAVSQGPPETVLAIGASAETEAMRKGRPFRSVNPFDHPRCVISDFTLAEKVLQHFMRKVSNNRLVRPAPVVIMHVLERLDGGLTQVEVRVLQELASGAGARESFVWTGRELMDHEIKSGSFPGDHWASQQPSWVTT